ncbi:MAG: HD domain-containing protein [Hungatella sp.]|nr:HD domain-containing protein [Hungatella sp.]
MANKNSVVADTIHGNISLTAFEKRVISHVIFNRLHDVYQNSTVYLTFPCNRTKRFEHSLGTMKLCSDMFYSAVQNADPYVREEFFNMYKSELFKILCNIKNVKYNEYNNKLGGRLKRIDEDALPDIHEKTSIFLNSPIELKENQVTYYILLQAVRIAALLHDIGHPPYSHISEFALNKIRDEFKESNLNTRIVEFNTIMDEFFKEEEKGPVEKPNDKKALHEQMGDKIVSIILGDAINDINADTANNNPNLFNSQVFEILVKETVEKLLKNHKPFDIIHRIIDGTLDGDRLDYITRDALNSGLDKGTIEYDRLCCGMTIAKNDKGFWVCPNVKSLNTVEDFLNRRWDIYKNIIFHHRVVKTDYLLQNSIEELCRAYLNEYIVGEPQNKDSDLLPSDISGLWKALKISSNTDSAYAISQWDDAWLMTVLKKHYFNQFINGSKEYVKLSKQLTELLTNKKYYFSVIKRLEDFLIIDNAITKCFNAHEEELSGKIIKIKELSTSYKNYDDENLYLVDPFLNGIEETLLLARSFNEKMTFQGLIFSHLKKIYNSMYSKDMDVSNFLNDIIQKAEKCFPYNSIENIFCVVKKYDIGIKKPLYFYDENQKKMFSIHEISSIARILDVSYDTFPQFFIYILKTDEYQNINLDLSLFLNSIGEGIAEYFYNSWNTILDKRIEQ